MADRGRATDWRSRDRGWCPERGPRGAGQGGGLPAARGQRREGPVSNAPEVRNVFIRRPIFAGVISIVIVLLGLFALRTLPVNSYPALTPPEIQVQAVYPGATAQDVATAVAAPIEQQLSGLDGLLYFKSSNSSAGVMNLSVYFDVSRNPDLAAVGVQDQIPATQLTIPVVTSGRLKDPAEFGQIILRGRPDASLVRLHDIGEVHLGARNYDVVGRLDGKPTALFLVFLRPGANALQVKQAVLQRMGELARSFPAGVHWSVPFDTTPYITASIHEVVKTLFEAMLLVTLVVFVFLQSWRATLIPVLAVPVSVIGAFFGMQVLGFSINLLTLFGLVLAIGIVVDDAIVVIENVERIMASEGVSPAVAADRAMRQVSRALIAIVLVLCSVFVPVAFLGGITGLMYRQFAITIAVAVVLSGIVALTLTPALCAV